MRSGTHPALAAAIERHNNATVDHCLAAQGLATLLEDLSANYDQPENAVQTIDEISIGLRAMTANFQLIMKKAKDLRSKLKG